MDSKPTSATGSSPSHAISDGDAVRLALIWGGANTLLTQLVSFAVFIILARELPLAVIGAFAFALVIVDTVASTGKSALMDTAIIRQDFSRRTLTSLLWIGLAVATLLVVLSAAAALPLERALKIEHLAVFLIALAATNLITPFQAVMEATMIGALRMRANSLRNMFSVVCGGAAALAVVVGPSPEWALVAQRVAQSLSAVLALWLATRFVPERVFDESSMRDLAPHTGVLWRNHLLQQAPRRSYEALVGAVLSAASLGVLRVLGRFQELLQQVVVLPLNGVVLPLLSRASRHDAAFAGTFLLITGVIALISWPAFVGLALVAPELIAATLTSDYQPYWSVLSGLCLAGLVSPVMGVRAQLLAAMHQNSTLARLSLIEVFGTIIVAVIAAPFGLIPLVWALFAVTGVFVVITLVVVLPLTGVSFVRYAQALAPPAFATIFMTIAVMLTRIALPDQWPAIVALIVMIVVGGVAYAGWLVLAYRRWLMDVIALVRPKKD